MKSYGKWSARAAWQSHAAKNKGKGKMKLKCWTNHA